MDLPHFLFLNLSCHYPTRKYTYGLENDHYLTLYYIRVQCILYHFGIFFLITLLRSYQGALPYLYL